MTDSSEDDEDVDDDGVSFLRRRERTAATRLRVTGELLSCLSRGGVGRLQRRGSPLAILPGRVGFPSLSDGRGHRG